MFQAAHQGNTEILQILLDAGASPDVWCCGSSAVQTAAYNNHAEAVMILLRAGASREGVVEAALRNGHADLARTIEILK